MYTKLLDLQQAVNQLQGENAEIRAQFHQSESRYRRAERRLRTQSGLALAVVMGTVLISPGSRRAVAQGYGVTLQQLANRVSALETNAGVLDTRTSALETKTQFVSVPADGEMHIVGTNLHIENGLGATNGVPGDPVNISNQVVNGKGNLILGYNAFRGSGDNRTGSHNVILGDQNNYSSFGGLVAGAYNEISAPYTTVSGGYHNIAGYNLAAVSGGYFNTASNFSAVVSGGSYNTASGFSASVSGGLFNTAGGGDASVSGGVLINATGDTAWAAGGSSSPGTFHSP